ncbi:MAG: hypothetical protein CMH54_14685 [Myxococcales bacterium]|nr:hypothetical protein [Myxococcales bacterium]
MRIGSALVVLGQNLRRNPKHYIFASVGILVGVAMLSFFVALGQGVRDRVLNRYFPVNQVEVEPQRLNILGIEGQLQGRAVESDHIADLAAIPGVKAVYPKQRSRFQARLWGGEAFLGEAKHGEAFFDGIAPALVREELQTRERGIADKEPREKARVLPCDVQLDCPTGFDCVDSWCSRHEYWTDFRSIAVHTDCTGDLGCPPDHLCMGGACRPISGKDSTLTVGRRCSFDAQCGPNGECRQGRCSIGVAFTTCTADQECNDGLTCQPIPCDASSICPDGSHCRKGRCGADVKVCDFAACRLTLGARAQNTGVPELIGGAMEGRCANEAIFGTADCIAEPCPRGSYCGTSNAMTSQGVCMTAYPVLVNPLSIDMYNATAASSLNLQRISDPRILLGSSFRLRMGDSFFMEGLAPREQITRQARLVGFSDKVPVFGFTVPLHVVQHANAHYKGRDVASVYDAAILVADSNSDVSAMIRAARSLDFRLGPSSREARKLSNMLFILTLVFGFISLVIIIVAAINIAHTFLMMVTERRHEIGVMRALGASPGDIRSLILLEAAGVGLFGGLIGHSIAYGVSRLANSIIEQQLQSMMFLPGDFFAFDMGFLCWSLVGAMVFAMVGALSAAHRAARLDPAVVLTNP